MKTVRLQDLQEKLQEDMPGVYLRQDYSRYQTILGIRVELNADYSIISIPIDFSPFGGEDKEDHSRVREYLRFLTEELRLRAIRELGLKPRLDAYDKEAQEYRATNKLLIDQLEKARARVGELELQIRALIEEDNDGA